MEKHPIYNGLQRPLVYKGFKGKYVYWALGCVMFSVFFGGLVSIMMDIISGIFTLALSFFVGILYISHSQKNGLYKKNKEQGIFVHRNKLNPKYG